MPGRVDAARGADGKFLPTGKTPKHGTKARYNSLGCRCPKCKKGNAAAFKAWRERKASASNL